VLGVNAVPFGGLLLAHWSGATTLALYWTETLIAVLTTAVCIAVHRQLTRRRGHWRPQLGLQIRVGGSGSVRTLPLSSFLTEFLVAGLAFSAAHAVLLAVLLAAFVPGELDSRQMVWGAAASLVVQLLALAGDLVGIGERPFAWIRQRAQLVLGRSVLIHLALLGGLALLYWQGRAPALFLPFAGLKLLADLAAVWPERGEPMELPDEPPGWVKRLAGRKRGGDGSWQRMVADERSLLEGDEEVVSPPSSGP
jgi:Family of unknown function (DUF6498)